MIFLDGEFNCTSSSQVNLVCATVENTTTNEVIDFWLHNNLPAQQELKAYLEKHAEEILNGYAFVAEARVMLALGLDPVKFKVIDQFIEYRMITNHNDELQWGKQLVDGKVKMTHKPLPKWQRTEEDSLGSFKITHSLAEATYKLTGVIRDTEHKNAMRDLIISNPLEFTEDQKIAIMKYCREDVLHLKYMFEKILEHCEKLKVDGDTLEAEMLLRGKYACITAHMESIGYPIDYEKTKNFSSSVAPMIEECQREINKLFPTISPFKYKKADRKFAWNQVATREWLKENVSVDAWTKTDGGDLSLALDAWTKIFNFSHDYPKDNFGAQMVRYLKLKQNMNGFVPNSKKRSFWDSVGPDQRVRPYFNIFGSQSSRSQPGATGFLFLKPAWMRALCMPPPGKAIASFDYSSEEYFISALLSRCKAMQEAYLSGDIYLSFAKLAGMVPKDATKKSHPEERQTAKSLVLGISYQMSPFGLSGHLTQELGRPFSEEEAKELVDKFYEVFPELKEWQQNILHQYKEDEKIKLGCGWYMFGDNENFRSVCNIPCQGLGASIMRKAVELAHDRGLKVILTLHDALYIEYDDFDFSAIDILYKCMHEAFVFYFPDDQKEMAANMRLEGYSWSKAYPEIKAVKNEKGKDEMVFESINTPGGMEIDVGNLYLDERSLNEYNTFSKYFETREESYL